MKNIYILIIFSLFIAIACNDEFMDKFPQDKISDSNYWKTEKDLELYANQFYPYLFDARLAWFDIDNYSDNQSPSNRNIFTWNEYVVPASAGGWGKADWLQIRSCNYALDHIALMKPAPGFLMYEGEIRFFKAFFYFNKVKKFGDVPWLETSLTTDSPELYAPRDPRAKVVENIIKELDFAIANLPETSSADRLTKYAALALKSDVCLYEGTFQKYQLKATTDADALLRLAATTCETIINSNLFHIYSTGKPNDDYFDLFVQYELKGNVEAIMPQRYITNKRQHNNGRQLGEQWTGYNKDFVQSYLCTDGLPIALSPLYKGDAIYGDEFVNRDPRMNQSIYQTSRKYRIYDDGKIDYKKMPEFQAGNCPTSYYILKGYSPYERDRLPSIGTIDDFIFRYATTVLNYAEAKAELGECTQTVLDITINKLRDRVAMPHLTADVGFVDPNWPNWEVPISPLLNEIRRERRLETCAEGKRWDDLVRWKAGKLLEDVKTVQGARDPATGKLRALYPGFATRVWNNKLYLYPIPTQELALNDKLVQNPGW